MTEPLLHTPLDADRALPADQSSATFKELRAVPGYYYSYIRLGLKSDNKCNKTNSTNAILQKYRKPPNSDNPDNLLHGLQIAVGVLQLVFLVHYASTLLQLRLLEVLVEEKCEDD